MNGQYGNQGGGYPAQAGQPTQPAVVGINDVILQGYIGAPSKRYVGQNNKALYKAKIVIPTNTGKQYSVKIAAWDVVAEQLATLPEGTAVKVHGSMNERSYERPCKQCGGVDKAWWSEILVDSVALV